MSNDVLAAIVTLSGVVITAVIGFITWMGSRQSKQAVEKVGDTGDYGDIASMITHVIEICSSNTSIVSDVNRRVLLLEREDRIKTRAIGRLTIAMEHLSEEQKEIKIVVDSIREKLGDGDTDTN